MRQEELKQAKMFFDALSWAKENGLEYEFFIFFLDNIKHGESIPNAIWQANREWDL